VDAELPAELRSLVATEDPATAQARQRATGEPPSPETGALLAWLAATVGARTVVEVGSAAGVTGCWLLRGLAERGTLTSIEPDPHTHGLARDAVARTEAGTRVRAILGDPAEVLPRLSDASYDLVVLQLENAASPGDVEHARRLLRVGGVLVARRVARRGDHAEARARFLQQLVDDEGFTTTLLPLDGGLVLATRRG
jgi:predicted O-methyltransferase YrrM